MVIDGWITHLEVSREQPRFARVGLGPQIPRIGTTAIESDQAIDLVRIHEGLSSDGTRQARVLAAPCAVQISRGIEREPGAEDGPTRTRPL